jgi:hypothetical protein
MARLAQQLHGSVSTDQDVLTWLLALVGWHRFRTTANPDDPGYRNWYWHDATGRWSYDNPPWGAIMDDIAKLFTPPPVHEAQPPSSASLPAPDPTPLLPRVPPPRAPPPSDPPPCPSIVGLHRHVSIRDVSQPPSDPSPTIGPLLTVCPHSARYEHANSEWLSAADLTVLPWHQNVISDGDIGPMINCMDATLFAMDMRGWAECQTKMWRAAVQKSIIFCFMRTNGKWRGFGACCQYCGRLVSVQMQGGGWESPVEMDNLRAQWLSFFQCPFTQPGSPEARIR